MRKHCPGPLSPRTVAEGWKLVLYTTVEGQVMKFDSMTREMYDECLRTGLIDETPPDYDQSRGAGRLPQQLHTIQLLDVVDDYNFRTRHSPSAEARRKHELGVPFEGIYSQEREREQADLYFKPLPHAEA